MGARLVLDPVLAGLVSEQFGVAEAQVRRDHLLSHLLAVISERHAQDIVFFGGTALARTHLPEGRLSEDLDLIAVSDRSAIAGGLARSLATGVRREFGLLVWEPALETARSAAGAVLRTADGLSVRVQLLGAEGYPRWPTEQRSLFQRYPDAPPASLTVPTLPAFAAAKTSAWHDRHAPRDLYDLWGLATRGALDAEAARLFARLGPTGQPPSPWMFDRAPAGTDWASQLSAQTRVQVDPAAALAAVAEAWAAASR